MPGKQATRKDSVDVYVMDSELEQRFAGRIKLVRGKIVAEPSSEKYDWLHETATRPHGDLGLRRRLVDPIEEPKKFLAAFLEQSRGYAVTGEWTPTERKDSVDLVAVRGEDSGKRIGRIRLVRGKLVTEGGAWVEKLITEPHGRWPDLVDPSSADPLKFLEAVVLQYDGSGLRAQWSPAADVRQRK